MPIYEFQAHEKGCEYCQRGFENFAGMADPDVQPCPKCGALCRKVFSVTARPGKGLLGNSNLKEKGFTKYVKRSDGQYTKEFGPGPDTRTRE